MAKRYRGQADYYAIWNEPNIGKTWLTPRYEKRRGVGTIDYAAAKYRQLYFAGYKSIAKYDPARRNRVLFGETAAISQPIPFLRAALCLDARGNPFRGARAKAQGCSGRVKKVNTLGFAHHPYNQGGNGTPQSKSSTSTSISMAYTPRLIRLIDGAARRGRIAARPGRVHHGVRLPVQPAGPDLQRLPHRAGPVPERVRPAVLRRPAASSGSPSTS